MGGLALKHVEGIRRYQADEFFKLADELIPKVQELFNTEAYLIQSYHTKESFGDMDIILHNNGKLGNVKEKITSIFNPKDIHFNGNVYSFDHKDLQVDLILTPTSNVETSKVFFSFNDLGNLMGKMYHKFGLKYGYDGLKYVYRLDNDKKLGDITVTKNMRKAFEFLGLSYEKFEKGFETMEEVFDYVVASPYFQKETFYFENLNAINKKRNNRRVNYHLFIEYVNGTGRYAGRESLPDKPFVFDKDKSKYFDMINDYFPESNFLKEMELLRAKEDRKRLIASKFNGNLVMERYGLTDIMLGKAIQVFKSKSEDFDTYVLHTDPAHIFIDFEIAMADAGIDLP